MRFWKKFFRRPQLRISDIEEVYLNERNFWLLTSPEVEHNDPKLDWLLEDISGTYQPKGA